MNKVKISGVVITLNEEDNIERCLRSMEGIVDEIVVVDSFSTDRTEELCKQFDVNFIQNEFGGMSQQKQFASSHAKYDFVLSLDADEALSDKLRESLLDLKNNGVDHKAYSMNRLTSYCGKWIHHSGWYPDRKVRFFDRHHARFGGENPHDKVIPNDGVKVKRINGDILHYSFPTIKSHAETANKFSEIAAKEAVKKGRKINIVLHIILNPIWTFFNRYIIRLGILDGLEGLIISTLSAYANFLKYTKIWFLSKGK